MPIIRHNPQRDNGSQSTVDWIIPNFGQYVGQLSALPEFSKFDNTLLRFQ